MATKLAEKWPLPLEYHGVFCPNKKKFIQKTIIKYHISKPGYFRNIVQHVITTDHNEQSTAVKNFITKRKLKKVAQK